MFTVWMSMNCVSKLTDVIQRGGERPIRSRSSCTLENDEIRDELSVDFDEMQQAIFGHNCMRNWVTVLQIGDPSRNIIEMIYRAASTQRSCHNSRNIKEVVRVHNSTETLETFEKYRESVKKISSEQYIKHPRSMVDGNEQLMFYRTTISCCTLKTSGVTKLCRNSACRFCRILQFGFSRANNSEMGIRLSTNSEELNDGPNPNDITISNKVKSVVIICRVITGRVVNMVESESESESEYDYDSVETGSNYLLVKHPSAVLPCFAIVLE